MAQCQSERRAAYDAENRFAEAMTAANVGTHDVDARNAPRAFPDTAAETTCHDRVDWPPIGNLPTLPAKSGPSPCTKLVPEPSKRGHSTTASAGASSKRWTNWSSGRLSIIW